MKRAKNIIIGLIVVLIGVLLLLKSLGVIENLNIFFEGWWTLFIIIPSAIGLVEDDDKVGSIIGIVIGVLLLLAVRDVISFDLIWKILVPTIIILIGLSIIFKDTLNQKVQKEISEIKTDGSEAYTATFSSQKVNLDSQEFKGSDINAIFGGVDLDLRNAKIKDDVVIKACAVFGGIDMRVPEDVNVKVVSTSIFGGVDDKSPKSNNDKKATIYVEATCLFGGVEIR